MVERNDDLDLVSALMDRINQNPDPQQNDANQPRIGLDRIIREVRGLLGDTDRRIQELSSKLASLQQQAEEYRRGLTELERKLQTGGQRSDRGMTDEIVESEFIHKFLIEHYHDMELDPIKRKIFYAKTCGGIYHNGGKYDGKNPTTTNSPEFGEFNQREGIGRTYNNFREQCRLLMPFIRRAIAKLDVSIFRVREELEQETEFKNALRRKAINLIG